MGNSLLMRFDYSDTLDSTVEDIFKRVAGLDVKRIYAHPGDAINPLSLVVTTHGDYDMSIVMSTSKDVLFDMTEHMKRGAIPSDSDIPMYAGEFFNILCGHFISRLNRQHHCSTRFSIPLYVKGHYVTVREEQHVTTYYYGCERGIVKFEILLFL